MTIPRLQATLVLACLLAAGSCDGTADDPTIPPRLHALAPSVEQERFLLGAPGIAVAVVEQGAVTFAHGFGRKVLATPYRTRMRERVFATLSMQWTFFLPFQPPSTTSWSPSPLNPSR